MCNVPKGAKPFDLQKALAGEKVINRKGEEIKGLRHHIYNVVSPSTYKTYTDEGMHHVDHPSEDDLFMAPKTKISYVVVDPVVGITRFCNKSNADEFLLRNPDNKLVIFEVLDDGGIVYE